MERRIQGHTESSLTPLGEEQAREVAKQLQDVTFDRAYSSSSERARDTARYILEHHDVVLELRDELREIFLGTWEGKLYAEVQVTHPENHNYFWKDPSRFALENAESFHDLQARAVSILDEIVKENEGKTILVVSHGAFIKALLCHYEGRHLRNFWQPPQMINCCHSIIEHNPAGNFVICQYGGLRKW